MRLLQCAFCGATCYPGRGSLYVRNDSKMFRFCKKKCKKHFFMKHNPQRTKWTKTFRQQSGKELAMDTTFEFEKRRNQPIRYNREQVKKTIKAMKIVSEIKSKRQDRFYDQRMKSKKKLQVNNKLREIQQGINLVIPPILRKEDQQIILPEKEKEIQDNIESVFEKKQKKEKN
ncbi:ribosome biogenesis protein rlp24-related [Anaeramoeba flamelloides]|uniref:Ribosome biogenesis protein rlp24-related n=1 Tax=Anaeramoeba flamelloides TaxID=1746091 RepID=A0AAV7ZPX2_9EUKA|nr:ribosome biogenesis protein rlp24-related [Anaeramoeba flamelloides]KAJ6250144.1 ribosome biogenesis protein rlp24-related [Anaeramoeba flamelloides]